MIFGDVLNSFGVTQRKVCGGSNPFRSDEPFLVALLGKSFCSVSDF